MPKYLIKVTRTTSFVVDGNYVLDAQANYKDILAQMEDEDSLEWEEEVTVGGEVSEKDIIE